MAGNVRFLNPKTLAPPPGYSYVVEATGPSRTIYIAGQLGLDLENKLVGSDFRSQATRAMENLQAALKAAGATLNDVVKINNYLTDMKDIGTFREVRDKFFNTKAPPASTTVAIPSLARPGAVFEIEAIAVLPGKKSGAKTSRGAKKPKRR